MFSKEAIALARATVEAIKKIAGRQEKECSRCYGSGIKKVGHPRQTGGSWKTGRFHCNVCNGTGKIKGKWEWEPEKWQRVIYEGKIDLIYRVLTPIYVDLLSKPGVFTKELIPLLHWENNIEPILEGMGYEVKIEKGLDFEGQHFHTYIRRNGELIVGTHRAKDRQTSVMQAVIELGKEI